jgi:hypothetical protein
VLGLLRPVSFLCDSVLPLFCIMSLHLHKSATGIGVMFMSPGLATLQR